MSQLIFDTAAKYLGTSEVKGPGSNASIQRWIQRAADWLDPDDSKTAWCGCFRAAIGYETGTGVPPSPYRAASWLIWGGAVPVSDTSKWRHGDTVIMTRPGGNHVCLLDKVVGKKAYCLGGNQSDAVSIAAFDISRITGVRRCR